MPEAARSKPDAESGRTRFPGVYAYRTRDGRTLYRFVYRDSNGRQSSKRGFASPRAARAAQVEVASAAARGELRRTNATFAEHFESWLERRRPYLEAGSVVDYRNHGVKRLIPEFGTSRLDSITTADVRLWLTRTADTGAWSNKTLNNALTVLVTCLGEAVADGKILGNPAARVKRLPLPHREPDYLRLDEIPRYLDGCSATYRPLAEVLIATGLRISEALALTWPDVDFRRRAIRVHRSSKAGGVGSTKGDRFRAVEIGARTAALLRDHRARQAEHHAVQIDGGHVFLMPTRHKLSEPGHWASAGPPRPVDRNTVTRDWHKDALKDAGLRDMPLHSLRHTAAAAWLSTGQPLVYVQRQLGHASITTTEAIYGHLEDSFLKGAASLTEAAIWKPASATPAAT